MTTHEPHIDSPPTRRGSRRAARLDVLVGPDLVEALKVEARARGQRLDAFMAEMLGLIVDDKLFNAIIDKK